MEIEYRKINEDEWPEYNRVLSATFLSDPTPGGSERLATRLELDRTIAAFDQGRIVATAGTDTFELTSPGGRVKAGGLTVVSVAPTHRRQGIMTQLMNRHLDDCRLNEEPVSILWAAESLLYGRFGFGPATIAAGLVIPTRRVSITVDTPGIIEVVSEDEAKKLMPPVYEMSRDRAGFLSMAPHMWETSFQDPEEWRKGKSARRYVICFEGEEVTGYATYRVKSSWRDDFPKGKVSVEELHALTAGSYASLWAFLLGHDLVETVTAEIRPPDEPLDLIVDDFRRINRRPNDGLWLQILEVGQALAGRRYQVEGTLVFEVPGRGRYRLEGGPDAAECFPTKTKTDITAGLEALSACYLGESRFGLYALAGKVEGSERALRQADLMFRWHERPWCPFVF